MGKLSKLEKEIFNRYIAYRKILESNIQANGSSDVLLVRVWGIKRLSTPIPNPHGDKKINKSTNK
jgi:hypothetical protein